MTKALRISSILVCMVLLMSIVGCPKKAVKPEPIPPPPVPEEEIKEPVKIDLRLQTIYFDFDRSDIRAADAEVLKTNAQKLKDNPDISIVIEGHCCPLGTAEYNMALGWRRATSAQNYLIRAGIAQERLTIMSYGEERLVTQIADDYWKNRRCEFVQK
ncbi:MAG: OmpA family protein [Candidatus Latescibacteria bacterium]|nr:OmpA family protein [Candidatus Latescibacterota bacterium]